MTRRELLRTGGGLYLILTEPRVSHRELTEAARERGVRLIQLREKRLDDRELLELARDLAAILRGSDTLLIINDRPDIARDSGADGVHLGRTDADYSLARALLGPSALVGLSTRTPEEAVVARGAGADYIGVGPVYRTWTKTDALEPIGTAGLAAVAARVPMLPKVAIGGIDAGNVPDAARAGADYAAVISAICHADDPVGAMDRLIAAWNETRAPRR